MKKAISIILVLVMLLVLTACGNKAPQSTENSTEASQDATQNETTEAEITDFVPPENYTTVLLVTINPQFRLYLDADGDVLAVEAVNNDAKKIVEQLSFETDHYTEAVKKIVTAANENDFIKSTTVIHVEITDTKGSSVDKDEVLNEITTVVNQVAPELKLQVKVKENKPSEGEATPTQCSHTYKDATCTAPKTCSACGATEGNAAGHSWTDATCTAPKTCSVCGATEGNAAGHNWKDVTCTAPKTCSVCGATEGNAAGHNWKDATCTAPKTCSVCGATEGNAAGHSWTDATCTAPKTCKACGATDGDAKNHSFADGKCTVCNEIDPTFKALETGCWSIERYVDDVWVTHSFFFSSGGSWGQPFWQYSFMEPASDATVQDAIANGVDVEKYKRENGKYYIIGGGDSGPATYTMDGDTITLSVYNAVITLRRTAGNQLTVEKYDGNLFVGNYDINIGDVFTWRECGHGFNDGKCSFCGAAQPNYKALDTGVWTGTQVVNGTLYKVKLSFKGLFFSAMYGANIHDPDFDPNFRDQLLQAYDQDKNALTVIDGVYYYTGSGDGGSITYTVNGNSIQADCDGWINLSITRTAGNQLTITKCDEIANLPGIILTWQEGE